MGDKFAVAGALREIALLMQTEGGNPFKARAYERGARAVEALSEDPETLVREGRLTGIPGIGRALAGTIEELVTTGRSAVRERLLERLPPGILELSPVLSPPRIAAIQKTLGIRTLADLEAACVAGRVRTVKGFGEKTESKILADIRALAERGEQTLMYRAVPEGEGLLHHARRHPAVVDAALAGDLRRRVESVTGLDLVLATADPEAALDHAAAFPLAAAVLQREGAALLLRLAGGLNVRVAAAPPAQYAWTLLLLTGSEAHVGKLQAAAAARGLECSAEGLRRDGRLLSAATEADVYRHLGLDYVPPGAARGRGRGGGRGGGAAAADLVAVEDIQGLVHCHTHYSDGKHTVEEMARGADALGMQLPHDHRPLPHRQLRPRADPGPPAPPVGRHRPGPGEGQGAPPAGHGVRHPGRRRPRLPRRGPGAARHRDRQRPQPAPHGRRPDDPPHRRRHAPSPLQGLGPRARPLRPAAGLRSPATSRRSWTRSRESRAAVEVNGDPHRLDMEPRWIREARKRGIRFVVSTDAHSVGALRNVRWGVDMARRGLADAGARS